MARTLVLLIAVAIALAGFGKGRAWSYLMMGTAYDQTTKNVLRNTVLFVGKQLVTTDSTGHYELTISGVTCDRGPAREIDRCNEEAYGRLVVRRVLSTASITIPSHWKSYAFRVPHIDPWSGVCRVDLYVP